MNKVFKIFEQLQSTNSRLDKTAILRDNEDNELFKTTLKWLLNPFVLTGLSDKKINKTVKHDTAPITDWKNMMMYFENNHTGSDIDISIVQGFIKAQPTKYQELYKQLITKSLKLGIDAKIVNSVFKDLVPVFNVMLGTPINKCKIKPNTPFSISRKLNGTRTIYYKGDFYTRSGKKYIGLDHIRDVIDSMELPPNTVIDGELLYKNKEGLSDSEAFQVGAGIANSKAESKPELKYCVFDILTEEDFEKGVSETTYFQRKSNLEAMRECMHSENLEVVPIVYQGTDQSEIQKWLDKCETELDWEGLMINLDTPYECKRTKNLIKVKCFYDIDIRCLRIEKGTGKNSDTLGAIVCDFKGNEVNVGSGFTDEQRNFYYTHPEEIVGKIVTIKYKEISKNKNGGESLQFPIFICVRQDKNEESYN